MRVEDSKATIELEHREMWTLAVIIEDRLEHGIEDWYNCLQNEQDGEALFFKDKFLELGWIETLYGLYGYVEAYNCFVRKVKRLFEEKRQERETEKKKQKAKDVAKAEANRQAKEK